MFLNKIESYLTGVELSLPPFPPILQFLQNYKIISTSISLPNALV